MWTTPCLGAMRNRIKTCSLGSDRVIVLHGGDGAPFRLHGLAWIWEWEYVESDFWHRCGVGGVTAFP